MHLRRGTRERHAPIDGRIRPALFKSAGCVLSATAIERQPWASRCRTSSIKPPTRSSDLRPWLIRNV